MSYLPYLFSFVYGSAIGSFVNVLVSRLNVAPVLNARSKCLTCGNKIAWYDLIPFVSYIILQGRCRNCKVKFGIENLLMEVFYGVIFILTYKFILIGGSLLAGLLWLLFYSIFFVTLGVISFYDLKHKLLPVNFFLGFLILCLFVLFFRFFGSSDLSLTILLSPIIVSFPFLFLWLISKGKWLGFGDVLMYMAVGAFFSVEQGVAVFLLSVFLGALTGVILILLKGYKFGRSIPFIPFITLAMIIVLFTDIDIYSIIKIFG